MLVMSEDDYFKFKRVTIIMKCFKKYLKSAVLIVFCAGILTSGTMFERANAQPPAALQTPNVQQQIQYLNITPLQVVNSPNLYLNKNIVMNAKFDKFSTLGLDYKPAFKSSDDYISFLIKRDDTSFDIPLSEMKLFLKRDTAEKFIDLKTDDEIEIKGLVFSDALGDSWIDVKELTITKKAPEKDEK